LTKILVCAKIEPSVSWQVGIKESAIADLKSFGRRTARLLLRTAIARLEQDPLAENKNMKTLRRNPVAQRELRLFGRYCILFNVEVEPHVTIILVGEKRGASLWVQGKEYAGHEGDPTE
jgi:mRNA-degrading endonuclease RelE of RelBE toxin-antitoxin system